MFLLLAVGRTASSPGVAREIAFWKKHGGNPERFLILWVEGEIHWAYSDFDWSRTTVLPNCLQGYFPNEPTIVDMRWMRRPADLDVNSKPFRNALATILSPVRGVPPGELIDEANAATRQALALAKSAVAVFAMLALLLGGVAWYATRQRTEAQRQTVLATDNLKEATRQRAEAERQTRMAKANLAEANRQRVETERQKNIAQANLVEANRQRTEAARQTGIAEANLAEIIRTFGAGLLAKALEYIGNGRVPEGTVLAAEAVQKDPQNWPAYAAVFEGLARLRYRPLYTREWCDDRDFLAISSDGGYVATVARQGNNDSFTVAIEHTTNGQIAQFELLGYPDGAVFSADLKYLFLVGTEIVVVDVVRERIISRIVAKTSEYLYEKLVLDPDPSYFWTIDLGAMYRFDMRAQAYDNTVVAFHELKAPGFNGTLPTNVARAERSGYWALGISGQSEGYTGEADDTGRIFLLDSSDAHVVAFINSGRISDMVFIGGDDRSDALYVAKPGGTIEIWPIPRPIRGADRGDEPLQGLDAGGQVLFFGTFSKVLFPSLRLSYLVVPPDLVPHFTAAISVTRRHAAVLDQAVLCDFIAEGHFGRHLRRMRQVYAERLSVLQESARARLAGLLDLSDIEAGLQTAGWLPDGITGVAAAKAAAARNVDVVPLSRHSRLPMAREGLQLGFAAVEPREIRRGVRELAIALEELL